MVICLERGADWFLPFWYWLTRVVLEKGPLNECCSSSSNQLSV